VLRGGKGNFGVVTAMEFELVPMPDFYGGGLMYPGSDTESVLTAFRGWLADLAMRPWATGYTMVNFHGRPRDVTDRARAWPPAIYEVIKKAKRRYDPNNMMRFGHAVILPSGAPVEASIPL
jgi:FAD/FMN-containing dehydrogenase